ncbi:Zinc finger DNA binding protein [Operophtera brumata]|uniref:Zinc finger DNA binding protein n=1 Tax=Operophtera brumata TaxID=104452 RepID=A0A0L7K3U4_OPEBR|nr:Zinc finger DNA binding protein [Operophtera brumata]
MSVVRSPPLSDPNLRTPPMEHYGSDPTINSSSTANNLDNIIVKRHKRNFSEFASHASLDSSEIKSMFAEIRTQQDVKFEALTSALTTIIAQNQDIQKSVDFLTSQYDGLSSKVSCLENEHLEYKKRVVNLEKKLHFMERQARSSTIEIRNIPKQPNENKQLISKIVQNIGVSLGLEAPFLDTEFKDIYRSKSEALVVEFTCTHRKESLLAEYRKFNKARRDNKEPLLNTSLIRLPTSVPPRPIYISEYLTVKARRVFYVARESVKNKMLAAAWTSFGKVYVKKDEGSLPVHVEEEEDLVQLIK